jgi:ABC-2 type transport system ATP-binding protein
MASINLFFSDSTGRVESFIGTIIYEESGKLNNSKLLVVKELTKTFGTFTAVDGLSFSVDKGQIFGFLGPNGAGKTTTIKMLTGLLKPTSGSASIGGYDVSNGGVDVKKQRGYLADNPFLYDYLTPYEFLLFMADMKEVKDGPQKADELLSRFSLEEKRNSYCTDLSHGMKKKTALAGAIIDGAPLLILDEPVSGLDPASQARFRKTIKSLAENGTTVLLSTHILEDAEKLCNRVGIINHGKLIATGTIEELKEQASKDKTSNSNNSLEEIFLKLTDDQ